VPDSLLHQQKDPNPCNPRDPCQKVSLAEKTVEDVLLHFGDTEKLARRRYREFIKKGITQGRRPEFQGGGLVRSAGGNKADLLGRKKEERQKGDARILGSGDFVSSIIKEANDSMDSKAQRHVSLDDLVTRVCSRFRITPADLTSKRRKREISRARAALCYLAVDQLDYSGEELARVLSLSGRGVSDCRDRGQKMFHNPEIISEYLS
jgi:putative transposase